MRVDGAVFAKLFALGAWQQIEIYVRKVCVKSCATSANCVCVLVCVWPGDRCGMGKYGKWQKWVSLRKELKQQQTGKSSQSCRRCNISFGPAGRNNLGPADICW